ncbi:AraC-type DNA-binding domain and AraC-containing protein [Chromobacterium violaceum]|uniref:AraC family transcriptional regulator n=1 Tax=Chromobacterium violaceum TaxID=536 RepID=UPI003CE6C44A
MKEQTSEQASFYHLEAFDGLEMLDAKYHRHRFSRHAHENFCVGVIEEGVQRIQFNGRDRLVPKGDIFLVNADEVHAGSAGVASGWSYRAIYPSPDMLRSLSRDLVRPQGSVPWFPEAMIHDPGLAEQLRLVFTLLAEDGNALLKETLLLSSLAWLMARHGRSRFEPALPAEADRLILRAKDYMDSFPERDVSLAELAALAELSPWHFLRRFRQRVGVPPHAYLVQARLRKARQLLLAGCPIPEAASACGFSDQSHFHRHFKRALGITPGQFAQRLPRR